jgi:sugar (pentulose or hexulose) kinase
MGARVIGIDVGTSGVRAAALADGGATVGSAAVAMTAFGDATGPRHGGIAFAPSSPNWVHRAT